MSGSAVPEELAAAILAGGRGERMGGVQKALLEIEGATILDRQLQALRSVVSNICVVSSSPRGIESAGLPIVGDAVGGRGPLDGLAAALAWSPAPHLLALACDMPFITSEVIAFLVAVRGEADAVVPRPGGRAQPLCALYPRAWAEVARTRVEAGELRLTDFVERPPPGARIRWVDDDELARCDPSGRAFTNVNRSDDLKNAPDSR